MENKLTKIFDTIKSINLKQMFGLIVILVLIVGLAVTVYLVGHRQNYRSKADVEFLQNFSITTQNTGSTSPQSVNCVNSVCTTDQERVHIRFNEQNTQDLLNSLP